MPGLEDVKETVQESSPSDWVYFPDPDVWTLPDHDLAIELIHPFDVDRLDEYYGSWLQTTFDAEGRQGTIRIKYRGVPYYECEVLAAGYGREQVLLPSPTGTEPANQTRVSEFQAVLGRILTEPFSHSDFDDTLDEAEIEVS
jgi:hypothetical protein